MSITHLKYFKTDGIRGKVGNIPMTPEFFLKLGWAIGIILGQSKTKKLIVGRDTRISGAMLQSSLESGILSTGASTLLTGCIPTPAISYLTKYLNASAGIVISGSHNLFNDNGIKIFCKNGTKLTKEIEFSIEKQLNQPFSYSDLKNFGHSYRVLNPSNKYISFCKSRFSNNLNLSKFTILLDCANGSTYNIAPKIFEDLGAKVITFSVFPNGININKDSGSTNTLKLKKLVILKKADIGLAFDGDGDRVIMVDHLGNEVDGDQIIYIIAREYLKNNTLNGGVVGTFMTNMGVVLGLKKIGIPFCETQIGDRYIYKKIKEKNWILGGEKSGHILLLDKHTTSDGIITSLQVLLIMINNNMTLYDLSNQVKLFPQVLLNVFLKQERNIENNIKVQSMIFKAKKLLGNNSRIFLRKSGTEPCVRIMVEGENYLKVYNSAHYIADFIRKL